MAQYRNISLTFWTDSKVDDDFTPEDKYFYLYLLTNPHTNICGCYEISMKQMERETGYNSDTVKRLLKRMETVHEVIRYNESTKEVLVINWSKYNWSASDKVKKAVIEVASHIKSEELKRYVMHMVSIRYAYSMETSVTDTDTDTVSETETETETENRKQRVRPLQSSASRPRFLPPDVETVENYCKETGIWIDVEAFVAYYEANGWMVGRNHMKDWKAAVRKWAINDKRNPKKQKVQEPEPSLDIKELEKLVNIFPDYSDRRREEDDWEN